MKLQKINNNWDELNSTSFYIKYLQIIDTEPFFSLKKKITYKLTKNKIETSLMLDLLAMIGRIS